LTSKLVEDTGGRGPPDWSEKHRSEPLGSLAPAPIDWRGAEAAAILAKAEALAKDGLRGTKEEKEEVAAGGAAAAAAVSTAPERGEVPCVAAAATAGTMRFNDDNMAIDEDQCAVAVQRFLQRVQQARKASCGEGAICTERLHNQLDPSVQERGFREVQTVKERRSVSFNLSLNCVHEVIPYMEIYGRHPREFVFGRHSEMLPAGDRFGFVGLDESSEVEPDVAEDGSDVDQQELVATCEDRVDDEFSPLCIHKVL